MGKPPLKLAILMVNGKHNYKNRRWIELSVEGIIRRTSARTSFRIFLWNHDYENPLVLAYLNSRREDVEVLNEANFDVDAWTGPRFNVSPERTDYFAGGVHCHRGPLQMLYEHATQNYQVDTVFTFDTDSWPIRDNWELPLLHCLDRDTKLVGIWRDELQAVISPYVHPSCLGVKAALVEHFGLRFDVEPVPRKEDTLSHFTRVIVREFGESAVLPLRRSNRKEYHPVFNGIYGHVVYHHHLGTRYREGKEREVKSYGWQNRAESLEHNKFILDATTDLVFQETEGFLDELCYGAKAIDFKTYAAYLRNNGTDEAYQRLLKLAREVVIRDPLEAYYIVGLIGKHFVGDPEFLTFSADLCEKLGHHPEAESNCSLLAPRHQNSVPGLAETSARLPEGAVCENDTAAFGLGLKPGDAHYRAYVGPPEEYDLIAAMTFSLLATVGLSENHRVLDIGCGSLRIGRLLIPFLKPGRYVGVEPHEWLVHEGIRREIGAEQVRLKKPLFFFADNLSSVPRDMLFDFAIAQSVFSHGTLDLIAGWLEGLHAHLEAHGILLATFKEGQTDFSHPKGLNQEDFLTPGWVYPKCVSYRRETIERLAKRHSFGFQVLDWQHPRQTWALFSREQFSPWWGAGQPLTWNNYLASRFDKAR